MDIFENGFNCNFDNVKILSDLKSFSISVDLISCDKDGYGEVEFVDSWAQGSHTYLITRSPTGYKTIVESKQLNGGDGTVCNRSQIWEDDNMISEKKDIAELKCLQVAA